MDAFASRAPGPDQVDLLLLPDVQLELEAGLNRHNGGRPLQVIEDEENLLRVCRAFERDLKYANIRRGTVDVLEQLLSAEMIPDGVDVRFRLGLLQGLGASRTVVDRVYLMRRDALFGYTISRFLSALRPLPPDRRPKIVFDAGGNYDNALDVLAWSKDSARVLVPRPDGLGQVTLPDRAASADSFVDLCVSRAHSACAEYKIERPSDDASDLERRRYVTVLYQRVQAKKGCDQRFNAQEDLLSLETFLRETIKSSQPSNHAWFAEALAFVLMDRAYVLEESGVPVERALTLARALGDDELEAFALRYANFTAGVSGFASDCLDRASERLLAGGRLVEFAYTRANAILTRVHQAPSAIDLDHAAALGDFALEWTPYTDRLSSILNIVGVAFLVRNRLAGAMKYFSEAAQANGGRLHQLSAQVNQQIVTHLATGRADQEVLAQLVGAIGAARMARKLSYQHTYLYANILALADGDLKREVANVLKSERFMDYQTTDVDDGNLLPFLASRFNWIAEGSRFRGARGDFVDRYGLLPLAQFLWS